MNLAKYPSNFCPQISTPTEKDMYCGWEEDEDLGVQNSDAAEAAGNAADLVSRKWTECPVSWGPWGLAGPLAVFAHWWGSQPIRNKVLKTCPNRSKSLSFYWKHKFSLFCRRDDTDETSSADGSLFNDSLHMQDE